MMGTMKNADSTGPAGAAISIECDTCVATGTTACADCLVTHLFANDDGPIEYVAVPLGRPRTSADRAIELFDRAGLLDDPVEFVEMAEFERGLSVTVGA